MHALLRQHQCFVRAGAFQSDNMIAWNTAAAGIVIIAGEGIAVEPVEPVFGTQPDITLPVLRNTENVVIGQSLLNGLTFKRGCGPLGN